ncbi:hypothetical protein [Streptomyces sp. CC210A]|uniref:hypothetical protein n=1 Tax=Streptomyces sp. CC210A TaxID=2898184 RepID=UPI001F30705D|nr:hypothetical protein [Streptomyces sp. CC210A]
MDSLPSPAQELVLIDRELERLDARRSWLLARRTWLLGVLRVEGAQAPDAPGWGGRAGGEASPRGVRTALLTLGGTLLAVAALAFTLVSWGALGIGGRTAVLSVVTVVALGVPVLLLRRGLSATAEAVAALALVLTLLDALALYLVAEPWAWGASGYAAVAAALLAVVWAGYGLVVRGLRAPLPAAVFAGQLPPVLAVVALGGDGQAVAWALLATGAADAVLALRVRSAAVGASAWVAAAVTAGPALLTGVEASLRGGVEPAVLLLAGAVLGTAVAWRVSGVGAVACAVVAGSAWTAAGGGLLRAVVPAAWVWTGYVVCAALPAVAVAVRPAARVVPQGCGAGWCGRRTG